MIGRFGFRGWCVFACALVFGTGGPAAAGIQFEGCTAGFWKNDADKKSAEDWPMFAGNLIVEPDQNLASVGFNGFTVDPDKDPGGNTGDGVELFEALRAKGGGEAALMRSAVAAVLNALHPSVDYELGNDTAGADQIIQLVNNALAAGDSALILDLKDMLNEANGAGCSLRP